jgi:FkbM family methyltransferase
MCTGEADPVMLLRDEGATEDQGLRHIAFYPSESCLRKMLYAAGFAFVYEFKRLPRHPHFQATFSSRRRRTVLAASMVPLTDKELFRHLPRQIERGDPWATPWSKFVGRSQRIGRFLAKPWHAKVNYVRYRWLKTFHVAVPVKLPWGAWWIAEYDFCGVATLLDGFEKRESAFVDSFLRPGMNVVDIGAHHGYYTLLSSRKTGVTGRVVAFEPSQRERKKLLRHLRLNRCGNVVVRDCALGSENGSAELFVVQGTETGCNSLRPPNVDQPVESLPVKIATLDGCLDLLGINRVDFIKMDVEGGEIEVLKGAAQLLAQRPRPVIMCEVQDIRTTPWGYPARLIVDFLEQRGFRWFSLSAKSKLDPMGPEERFDGNYIAVPEERIDQLLLHATDSAEASSSHLCA